MIQVRVKGHVVGYDEVGGELLWKVKVRDASSIHNDKKFLVHSLHPGTMLSRPSVDVSFRVEPVQVGQEQILKAVDVAIGQVSSVATNADVSRDEDAIFIFASELDGEVAVCVTGLSSLEELKSIVENGGEQVISFIRVPYKLPESVEGLLDDSFQNSMGILHGLLCSDDIQPAFEHLLTQVFIEGRQSAIVERGCE